MTALTFGLTRLSAGWSVLVNEFTVNGEQHSALAWAEVAIGVDRLSDARSAVIAQFVQQEVPQRARQRTWTHAQGSLGPGNSLGCRRGLTPQPLRDGGRRELQVPSQLATGHASVIQRLPQRFTKGLPLLGCSHWPDAPLSVVAWQQACPIRQRPVDPVASRLTTDSYQATVVSVAAVLAHCRDFAPHEGAPIWLGRDR